MPLLMCPNDNSSMTTVERAGVQFDMCPTCRGVWLDRGELEKLMASSRDEAPAAAPPAQTAWREPRYEEPPYQPPPRRPREGYDDDDDYDDRRRYAAGPQRKKRFDLFDIFD